MLNFIKRLLSRNQETDTMEDIVDRFTKFNLYDWCLPDGFKVKKKPNEYEPMLMWVEDVYYKGELVLSVEHVTGRYKILRFRGGEWVNVINHAHSFNSLHMPFFIERHDPNTQKTPPPPRHPPSGTKMLK